MCLEVLETKMIFHFFHTYSAVLLAVIYLTHTPQQQLSSARERDGEVSGSKRHEGIINFMFIELSCTSINGHMSNHLGYHEK